MRKMYYLGTCSTCARIIKESDITNKDVVLQDIKKDGISEKDLDEMKALAGSCEALFSRKAIKYKTLGLKDKVLEEEDYKKYILEDYTFLKRPVTILGKAIFIGNSSKEVAKLKEAL